MKKLLTLILALVCVTTLAILPVSAAETDNVEIVKIEFVPLEQMGMQNGFCGRPGTEIGMLATFNTEVMHNGGATFQTFICVYDAEGTLKGQFDVHFHKNDGTTTMGGEIFYYDVATSVEGLYALVDEGGVHEGGKVTFQVRDHVGPQDGVIVGIFDGANNGITATGILGAWDVYEVLLHEAAVETDPPATEPPATEPPTTEAPDQGGEDGDGDTVPTGDATLIAVGVVAVAAMGAALVIGKKR